MSKVDDGQIHVEADTQEFVTMEVAGQLFGIEVTNIHDVFKPLSLTKVPMAPPEVKGILNLRGRIITAIDARIRLGLPAYDGDEDNTMAIGVEIGPESFSLIVDSVGEVLRLSNHDCESNPNNMDPLWQSVSKGVYRLDGKLLIILDIHAMLSIGDAEARAA